MFQCYLCDNDFTQKISLQRHLNQKRCKSELLVDLIKLNDLVKELTDNSENTMFHCYICNNDFSQKMTLNRHLKDRRCKSQLLQDSIKLNDFLKELTNNKYPNLIKTQVKKTIKQDRVITKIMKYYLEICKLSIKL